MAAKITIRLVLLLLIVTGLNFVYVATFYERDLAEYGKEHQLIRSRQPVSDIFYFGESSNATAADDDSVKTSIADLMALFYPSRIVVMVNKEATHAGIYRNWLNSFDLKEKMPAALVITLNMRSFDAAWLNSELEAPLQQSVVFSRPFPPLVNRIFLGFETFEKKDLKLRDEQIIKNWEETKLQFPFSFKYSTVKEWDRGTAQPGFRKTDGSWDQEKTELACHYVKTYAFNITEDNPRVKDFDAITAWCAAQHVPLYLNLLAENVEYADSLVGKELVFLMRQNRDWLVRRYSTENCTVVDNLELVNGKDYIDQNWTTEHYKVRGRMRIARNLAEQMKKDFKQEYKKAY